MKIVITKDVYEKDRLGNNAGLKVSAHHRRAATPFVIGRVVDMSDATGKKYIKRGLGREATEEEAAEHNAELRAFAIERDKRQAEEAKSFQEWKASQVQDQEEEDE